MKQLFFAFLFIFLSAVLVAKTGDDVESAFRRAADGGPLRAVFIGGSITQAGNGWITGWLEKTFPKSTVLVHNAGMSATGSALGVFRLNRDVIAHQPDIVFLEFAVNDGGMSDERTIRFLESIVVRLKSLKNPPAVVFIETAARNKSNRKRHHAVAKHYGLFEIDLQLALDEYLEKNKLPWGKLMGDDVHPNKEGHAFYSSVIADKLTPFAERANAHPDFRTAAPSVKLPAPMSSKSLLPDADMQVLPVVSGWSKAHSVGHWWDMFLLGAVRSGKGGAKMYLPFRGSVVGIMYAMSPKYGHFYVSVDGAFPKEIKTNSRHGYAAPVLADDLEPGEHMLSIIVPEGGNEVNLAYLLTAGDKGVTGDLVPQKKFISKIVTEPIPVAAWEMSGPYGTEHVCVDGPTPALNTVYAPEPGSGKTDVPWKKLSGTGSLVNLAELTGLKNRGVSYVRTRIPGKDGREVVLGLTLDYFGKVWLNGKLIRTYDSAHGGVRETIYVPVILKKGDNELLLKVHAGSAGNECSASVNTLE